MANKISRLWVEKYRPKTEADLIISADDSALRSKIRMWIDTETVPNILFSGPAGCGKTTIAQMLCRLVDDNDLLVIDASTQTGISMIREEIVRFVNTAPFGKFKIVFLDEFNRLSPEAQDSLKRVIEGSSDHVRFIACCNAEHRVIPELKSRFQHFAFSKASDVDILARCIDILDNEQVQYNIEDLADYVSAYYPDIRKTIQALEQYTVDSVLLPYNANVGGDSSNNYMDELVELLKAQNWHEARKLVCTKSSGDDWEQLYTFMYKNVELMTDDLQMVGDVVVIIAKYAYQHNFVADPEINCASMFYEIISLLE